MLLALGGPTEVTVTDSLTAYPVTSQLIGISQPGDLVLKGASAIRSDVLLNSAGILSQSGPSYISSLEQDDSADAYLNLARWNAVWGARCIASFTPTIDIQSVNISDSSGNTTIYAEQQINVVNLGDLNITNGSLTLSSHFTSPDLAPTLIVNIFGTLQMDSGAKILLDGTLDEIHVLFNVVGPGPDVAISGTLSGDSFPVTQLNGVLLAPFRNIHLTSALVNGAVIGGGDEIAIKSGSQIMSNLTVVRN